MQLQARTIKSHLPARALSLCVTLLTFLGHTALEAQTPIPIDYTSRMLRNCDGNDCVACSDINALVYHENNGIGGLTLKNTITPKIAKDSLKSCFRRHGLTTPFGIHVAHPNFAALFCKCNKEVVEESDFACEHKSFPTTPTAEDMRGIATTLESGGLVLLKLCPDPPFGGVGHAVTATEITWDEEKGGGTVTFIDSNILSSGQVISTISPSGVLSKPALIDSPIGLLVARNLCGFISKVPAANLHQAPLRTDQLEVSSVSVE